MTANQELTQSEFLMPLGQHYESVTVAGGEEDFIFSSCLVLKHTVRTGNGQFVKPNIACVTMKC